MTEIKKVNIDPIAKSYRILFCPGYPLSDIKGFGRLGFIISNLVFGAYKITNRRFTKKDYPGVEPHPSICQRIYILDRQVSCLASSSTIMGG